MNKLIKTSTFLISAAVLFMNAASIMAQTAATEQAKTRLHEERIIEFAQATIIILAVILLTLVVIMSSKEENYDYRTAPKKDPLWERVKYRLTGIPPVSKEREVLLDHSYDGINELDNGVPPWLSWLFNFTVVVGVIYVLNYDVFGTGKSQHEEWALEVEVAKQNLEKRIAEGTLIDENNATELVGADDINKGKDMFTKDCSPCHGQSAEGGVGPNLTDKYWLHGGDVKDLFRTVKFGVPEKGMVSWQKQYSPRQIQQVISYILTLQGTNPPNGKAPQGTIYERKDSTATTQQKDTTKGK